MKGSASTVTELKSIGAGFCQDASALLELGFLPGRVSLDWNAISSKWMARGESTTVSDLASIGAGFCGEASALLELRFLRGGPGESRNWIGRVIGCFSGIVTGLGRLSAGLCQNAVRRSRSHLRDDWKVSGSQQPLQIW